MNDKYVSALVRTTIPNEDLTYATEGCDGCHNFINPNISKTNAVLCLDSKLWEDNHTGYITRHIGKCTCNCHLSL